MPAWEIQSGGARLGFGDVEALALPDGARQEVDEFSSIHGVWSEEIGVLPDHRPKPARDADTGRRGRELVRPAQALDVVTARPAQFSASGGFDIPEAIGLIVSFHFRPLHICSMFVPIT